MKVVKPSGIVDREQWIEALDYLAAVSKELPTHFIHANFHGASDVSMLERAAHQVHNQHDRKCLLRCCRSRPTSSLLSRRAPGCIDRDSANSGRCIDLRGKRTRLSSLCKTEIGQRSPGHLSESYHPSVRPSAAPRGHHCGMTVLPVSCVIVTGAGGE